jgi:hypothetical protein
MVGGLGLLGSLELGRVIRIIRIGGVIGVIRIGGVIGVIRIIRVGRDIKVGRSKGWKG